MFFLLQPNPNAFRKRENGEEQMFVGVQFDLECFTAVFYFT